MITLEGKSGKLWGGQRKMSRSGVMLEVRNRRQSPGSLRQRFHVVALGEDRAGAVDERGQVLVLDFAANEYRVVGSVAGGASAATWAEDKLLIAVSSPRSPRLSAFFDGGRVVDNVAQHRGRGPISSLECEDEEIVSASRDAVILWDAQSFAKIESLAKRTRTADVAAARFVDRRVCVLYADGSIIFYTRHFQPAERLSLPHLTQQSGVFMPLRSIAGKADGTVAGAGLFASFYLWDIDKERLIGRHDVPRGGEGTVVLQIEYYQDQLILLCDDGSLLAYDDGARQQPEQDVPFFYEIAPRSAAIIAFAVAGDKCLVATSDGTLLYINLSVARLRKLAPAPSRPRVGSKTAATVPPSRKQDDDIQTSSTVPPPSKSPTSKPEGVTTVAAAPPQQTEQEPSLELARPPPNFPMRKENDTENVPPIWSQTRKKAPPAAKAAKPLHRVSRLESGKSSWLTPERLRCILAEHGEYPARYRSLIWRMVLSLPENDDAYAELVNSAISEEVHDAATAPASLKSVELICSREKERLVRVVRALGAWCSPLTDAEWLGCAAYPMIKVFEKDEVCAFETTAVVLAKFARSWLSCWPEPPLPALACLAELCDMLTPTTAKVLAVNLGIEPREWAWPMMRALFSETLPSSSWLRLWDAVLSAGPERGSRMVALTPVAFVATQASAIAACVSKAEILDLVRRPLGAAAANATVAKVKRLEALVVGDDALRRLADGVPSSDGQRGLQAIAEDCLERARAFPFPMQTGDSYPAMSAYPRVATDLARREREKIALEVARSKAARELEAATARLAADAEASARRLAATEAATAIAEEAAYRRTEEAEQRRLQLDSEARAAALARRMKVVEVAESRTKEALDAARRRRELAGKRAEHAAKSAEARLEEAAKEAAEAESAAALEAAAVDRVARAREALEQSAQATELADDLEARSRRLELEARIEATRRAEQDANDLAASRRAEQIEAEKATAEEVERSRRAAERAFLEAALAKEATAATDAAQRERRRLDQAAKEASRRKEIDDRRSAAREASAGLQAVAQTALMRRGARVRDEAERRAYFGRAVSAAADAKAADDRASLALEKEIHGKQVQAVLRAAEIDDLERQVKAEQAMHEAVGELDKDRLYRELRDAQRAANAAKDALALEYQADVRQARLEAVHQERERFARVREDAKRRAIDEKAALDRKLIENRVASEAETAAQLAIAAQDLRRQARAAQAKRLAEDYLSPDPPLQTTQDTLIDPADQAYLMQLKSSLLEDEKYGDGDERGHLEAVEHYDDETRGALRDLLDHLEQERSDDMLLSSDEGSSELDALISRARRSIMVDPAPHEDHGRAESDLD